MFLFQAQSENDSTASKGKTEDVLIKVVRVIANLSINEDIGPVIATNDLCVAQLEQILGNHRMYGLNEKEKNEVV